MALQNWHVLTDSNQQLRPVRLFDGLQQAAQHHVDVLLSTELATTEATYPIGEGTCVSDWNTSRAAGPGKGVGAFVAQPVDLSGYSRGPD